MRLRWMLLVGLLTLGWLFALPVRAQVAKPAKSAQDAAKAPPAQTDKPDASGARPSAKQKSGTKGGETGRSAASDGSAASGSPTTPAQGAASKGAASGGSAAEPSRGNASTPSPGSKGKSGAESQQGAPPASTVTGSGAGGKASGPRETAAAKPADGKGVSAWPSSDKPSGEMVSGGGATAVRSAGAQSAPVDGATFVVRLRDLEQRIDELKEQIRRSHTRLSLLSDTILASGVGGARAEITFINDLSDVFRLDKLLVVLDGSVQYNKVDDGGGLSEQGQIPIFTGSIPPGDHTVQVLVKLRGHGYGVFSYLRGYHFEIKDSHSFTITEGKTANLEIIVFEEGGMTTQVEERPRIRYAERIESTAREAARGKRRAGKAQSPSKKPQPKQTGAK